MYLNEKSWQEAQDDIHMIDSSLKEFLNVYRQIKKRYPRQEIFVPEGETLYLQEYPLNKWIAMADIEYRRLYLSFWNRRITYNPEDEYELLVGQTVLKGGTEACLNASCMFSIGLDEKWTQPRIPGLFVSMDGEEEVEVANVFHADQLDDSEIKCILDEEAKIPILSYEELWDKKDDLFPHLCFCPSVEADLQKLENYYLSQIVQKLEQLEQHCAITGTEKIDTSVLSKTTVESQATLDKYTADHTFRDEKGKLYVASWHMRFTGIPGRIFFVPGYEPERMLVCYIGKKLKNVSFPT